MKVINQRSNPFAGKTWIRQKQLDLLKKGEEIRVKHSGDFTGEMILTKDHVEELEKNKSDKPFTSKFTGEQYYLYGIDWQPDVDKQGSLFGH